MDFIAEVPPDKARKRVIPKGDTKRGKKQENIYSPTGLPKKPSCQHKKKVFNCTSLTSNEIFKFHQNFYFKKKKIDQDNFILQHCKIEKTARKRPTTNSRSSKNKSVKYLIRKRDKSLITVCRDAFLGILRIKPNRLKGVIKRHFESGLIAHERRGGDRKAFEFASRKEAVKKFIQKFKPLESHYLRGKDRQRIYLNPDLNIRKMSKMYNDEASPGLTVTESFFRKIFTRSFNIGFGSTRQDMCSFCIQLKEQIKGEKSNTVKQSLMTKLRIHQLRYRAFFKLLREEREELVTISFDCQKNLPLPKVADQSAYYSRQLYIYNFTVVKGSSHAPLNKENVTAYVWTEDVSSKSSNEICSAVYHYLNSITLTNVKTIRLMADGCGGQNKNSIVIGMVSKWMSTAPLTIKRVEIIFPVTGHSFMPADRVFALTEKEIRKYETIAMPEEYEEIIKEHATLHKLGTEVQIMDWRKACRESLKDVQRWNFQISKIKRVILKRGRITGRVMARGEVSYNSDISVARSVLRVGKTYCNLNPDPLPIGVAVAAAKLNDVKKLLQKHYGNEWENNENLQYYKNVLNRADGNVDERVDDECCEQELEEVLDCV